MELCVATVVVVMVSILTLAVAGLQAIAGICKQGGVTIRIIREAPDVIVATAPETAMSKEEQAAMEKYNEEQSQFLSSIRNLQKLFIADEQMPGEGR